MADPLSVTAIVLLTAGLAKLVSPLVGAIQSWIRTPKSDAKVKISVTQPDGSVREIVVDRLKDIDETTLKSLVNIFEDVANGESKETPND